MTTNTRRSIFSAVLLASFSALAGLSVAGPASAAPTADAYQQGGSYYFVSPSNQWHCAIVTSVQAPSWAGCKGPMPANAPSVQGGGVQSIHPNGVSVSSVKPGTLTFYSDTSVSSSNPASVKVLPYGTTLTAGGISCVIDASRGITCESGDHAFTVSSERYQLR
ncbi:hypothetical protein [Gordonia sp. CPCC 205333]|uniref:hypothetical protein n=1 Tax=Gordonia sp. CPCC 205333 TaxID=3140790 RepID=UPI003AF3449E